MSDAKYSEGDIMEGIFTLAIGLYIADGKIDKSKLNRLRRTVNTDKFASGGSYISIARHKAVKGKSGVIDTVSVLAKIVLKKVKTDPAFGQKFYQEYRKKGVDVGEIDKKVNTLISDIHFLKIAKALAAKKKKYMDNNTQEHMFFFLESDGVGGEQSGGSKKADLIIRLWVDSTPDGNTRKHLETVEWPVSIKSESKTVANLAPYDNMVSLMGVFGGQWGPHITEYEKIIKDRNADAKKKTDILVAMFQEVKDQIKKISNSQSKIFTQTALRLFSDATHGDDNAQVVDIHRNVMKEIDPKFTKFLVDKLTVRLTPKFDDEDNTKVIKFVDKNLNLEVFQIRIKMRTSSKGTAERKLMIEAGNLMYLGLATYIQVKAEQQYKENPRRRPVQKQPSKNQIDPVLTNDQLRAKYGAKYVNTLLLYHFSPQYIERTFGIKMQDYTKNTSVINPTYSGNTNKKLLYV